MSGFLGLIFGLFKPTNALHHNSVLTAHFVFYCRPTVDNCSLICVFRIFVVLPRKPFRREFGCNVRLEYRFSGIFSFFLQKISDIFRGIFSQRVLRALRLQSILRSFVKVCSRHIVYFNLIILL